MSSSFFEKKLSQERNDNGILIICGSQNTEQECSEAQYDWKSAYPDAGVEIGTQEQYCWSNLVKLEDEEFFQHPVVTQIREKLESKSFSRIVCHSAGGYLFLRVLHGLSEEIQQKIQWALFTEVPLLLLRHMPQGIIESVSFPVLQVISKAEGGSRNFRLSKCNFVNGFHEVVLAKSSDHIDLFSSLRVRQYVIKLSKVFFPEA